MFRIFQISVVFCLLSSSLLAQKLEIGFFAGGANYLGELSPEISPKETKPYVGANIKRVWNPYFSGSLNFSYGQVSGSDKNFKSLAPRGLSFRSPIMEISPQIEFNFFRFGGVGVRTSRFTPYVFAGLAFFTFNPSAKYEDKWYKLQPLSTEGQGLVDGGPKGYKTWSIAIPMGGGVKINLNDKWNLLFNCGYRVTFTDYLDDVGGLYPEFSLLEEKKGKPAVYFSDPSAGKIGRTGYQRGNPDNKDWYIFTGVTLSYIITQSHCYTF